MELRYHEGQNFGDALNPIVFNEYLNEFLKRKDNIELLGIGSILGSIKPSNPQSKFLVFSSGFAAGDESTYGAVPEITEQYKVICVRGPHTAKKIGVNKELAISDGALLMPLIYLPSNKEKKYRISFIPHVGSTRTFDGWESLLGELGFHFIDPKREPIEVINDIVASEVVITEAMHGAILSDAYRVPWIPVTTNPNINQFKWEDYLSTVNLTYSPTKMKAPYAHSFINERIKSKLGQFKLGFLTPLFSKFYSAKNNRVKQTFKQELKEVQFKEKFLCEEDVLKIRQDELLKAIEKLKVELNGDN